MEGGKPPDRERPSQAQPAACNILRNQGCAGKSRRSGEQPGLRRTSLDRELRPPDDREACRLGGEARAAAGGREYASWHFVVRAPHLASGPAAPRRGPSAGAVLFGGGASVRAPPSSAPGKALAGRPSIGRENPVSGRIAATKADTVTVSTCRTRSPPVRASRRGRRVETGPPCITGWALDGAGGGLV